MLYEPATEEEIATVLAAFYAGRLTVGYAINFGWPERVRRVLPGPAVPPGWSPEAGLLDSRLDAVEAISATRGSVRLSAFDTTGVLEAGTDATAVLNTALAALYAAGGGTLEFPTGTILIAGQVVLPNNGGGGGGSGAQKQPPMMWRGTGAHASGQNESGTGGTRLLCTYDSASYNAAKFVTRGLGQWAIEDITFQDTTTNADTPFIYTTNTTVKTNRCAFLGASVGAACQQDAIVLGGTIKPISTGYNDPDSAFQGYGTVIANSYFNGIRRAVYGRSYCNQVQVIHNMFDKNCGSNLPGGAPVEFDGSLDLGLGSNDGDYCTNPLVMGNYMHAIYYVYGVKLIKTYRANIIANGYIDVGAACLAVVRCEGTTIDAVNYPSLGNLVMGNTWTDADVIELSEDSMSRGRNTLIGSESSQGSVLTPKVKLPGAARLRVDTPTASVADFRITDDTIDYLQLGFASGGTWTMRGPLEMVGNAVGGTSAKTRLNIGDNSFSDDAVINLKAPTGKNNSVQWYRAGVASWRWYDGNSAILFLRSDIDGIMALTFTPGSATAGRIDAGWRVRVPAARGIEYGSGGPISIAGAGTPEGLITGPVGSTYQRTDGGAGTSLYVKESGAGNTGWVAK